VADRVLILGASARAAAASARRAGLDPFAIDLFADADTKQLCDCLRCPPDRYPEGLFELARQAPPMPWMYTGGLENYPALIVALARERKLWGNGADILHTTRHPFALSALLSVKGLSHPELLRPESTPPDSTSWLRKPVRSAGGRGIRFADPGELSTPGNGYFHQAFIAGPPMSALCAGRQLLGYTAQLIGTHWLHAPSRFCYAGNVGPIAFSGDATQDTVLTAFRLGDRAGVTGVYGIDFIPNGDRAYIVEVNPRYPASAEVMELAWGLMVLDWHRWFYFRKTVPPVKPKANNRVVGKAIYYAPHRLTFPASGPWDDSVRHAADVWRRPDFADVPHRGEAIEAGHPVLTILTEANTEAECLARLQSRAAELDRLFGFPTPEGETCRP
jgi:predicted ATP-grasp superfamily ATP-dependent carboligase